LSKFRIYFYLFFFLFTALVASTKAADAQSETGHPVYIVQAGDTLSLIANRFGTTIESLVELNKLENPNSLDIGDTLLIPGFEGIEGVLEIKAVPLGENITTISRRQDISIINLVKLNRITSPYQVCAGTSLIYPSDQTEEVFVQEKQVPFTGTMLEIAVMNKTTPWEIIESNQVVNENNLIPGDLLYGVENSINNEENAARIESITMNPLPIHQGQTAVVQVITTGPFEISGRFSDQTFQFSNYGENTYIALIGIPALIEPGLIGLQVQGYSDSIDSIDFFQQILVESGNFTQESIEGVDSSTIDPATIEQENQILQQVSGSSAIQQWTGLFQYPVDKPCPASLFGNRRTYNSGSYNFYHTGMDFTVCAENLKIYAAAKGTVVFTGSLPIKGNFTIIDHGLGIFSGYAHQSKTLVEVGQEVDQGQLIGEIGSTGRSVGPHLHWEIWVNHIPVDPQEWVTKIFPLNDPGNP